MRRFAPRFKCSCMDLKQFSRYIGELLDLEQSSNHDETTEILTQLQSEYPDGRNLITYVLDQCVSANFDSQRLASFLKSKKISYEAYELKLSMLVCQYTQSLVDQM